ncbi:hypothetical protein LXL04_016255 [Taraxacum kok-saghyz]
MGWKRGPVIGRGSYATVSVATTSTGDLFAVKSTAFSASEFLQKEQQFLSQLSSKYIIKYMGFDVDYEDNKPMYNLFMEYASGGTISDVIKKQGGSLDESLIRSYTHQILLGLDHLHCNNLVHCDIKCRNLLVCEEGVKIGDLGCAKLVEIGGATTSQLSGTPVFMAPEVARGEEQSFPADVWALGCSVIEMTTGSNPWPEMNDPVSALYRIGYSGDTPEFPMCLSDDGNDFLAKCLKIDAKERKSPTSTLDQSFWESLSVSEPSPEESTQMDSYTGESPGERIRGLASCLPNWDDEEDWITIRRNEIEEMDLDSIQLFSFSNLNVDFDEELESSVSEEEHPRSEGPTKSTTLFIAGGPKKCRYLNVAEDDSFMPFGSLCVPDVYPCNAAGNKLLGITSIQCNKKPIVIIARQTAINKKLIKCVTKE